MSSAFRTIIGVGLLVFFIVGFAALFVEIVRSHTRKRPMTWREHARAGATPESLRSSSADGSRGGDYGGFFGGDVGGGGGGDGGGGGG
ncbi:hypothetical protein N802_16125 [Knoellia sinensis KCTC 19936]|uniref:Uncharacterized protein n=1 Tax=Knoellia sinensis KCTC 19936 TaxID=1385520 RepID=A0A0A0JAK6_9MICO|nr:hypothetical protein [Knoellia sinensis]KGN33022.1 hypothetical protein N802_16125 [Knoellia sinensis KCTC 19936]